MNQKIVGFHRDDESHWVADLECGHKQHVRHDPPFHPREWVTTPEKREERIGSELNCKRCDEVGLLVAKAVLAASVEALLTAQADSAVAGLCREGQFDLALDRLKSMDLEKIFQEAIVRSSF